MDDTENRDAVEEADRAMGQIERTARHAERCWPVVIAGLYELRQRAMRATRTNDIGSGRYRAEFSRLRGMHKHLAKLKPHEASACCWAAEHPDLYEAAKGGMNAHHGQAPTPYGVYQRAQRIAKAKDAAAAEANRKERREADKLVVVEAERDIADIAEDRDRLAMRAHAEKEKAQRIEEHALGLEQRIVALEEALARVTAERDTLLAQVHGTTPATVLAALRDAIAAHGGNLSATAKALGYANRNSLYVLLADGEKMTAAAAMACHRRLEAWRAAAS